MPLLQATDGLICGVDEAGRGPLAGPVTAIPLLLFASASVRVPLSTMGILQYVAPILQFLTGWLIIGEQMPPARWLGFGIIWVAVLIFIIDALHHSRQGSVEAEPVLVSS